MNLGVIREQRKILHANMLWRKNYVESTVAAQAQIERNAIISNIDRLAPGVRVLYLKKRLQMLKERLE